MNVAVFLCIVFDEGEILKSGGVPNKIHQSEGIYILYFVFVFFGSKKGLNEMIKLNKNNFSQKYFLLSSKFFI